MTLKLKTLITAFVFILTCGEISAQAAKLKVIPEVQLFIPSPGAYSIPSTVNILVNTSKNDSLLSTANLLKEELFTMFKVKAAVITTTASTASSSNEILLNYTQIIMPNKEGYKLTVSNQGITIGGASVKGTFWGTRTLLQLIENHKNTVPCGNITDSPHFPVRGFMLDVGRKFFTIDFLRHYVKLLSYYKMNELHVHLNDNGFKQYYGNNWANTYSAFRLQSETYPSLAAADGHYTKAEFRELQLLGMKYGVKVIPEIDIPAHSLAFTKYKPELRASAPYAADHLAILDDTKLPVIYDFFDKLFSEYIDGPNPTFVDTDVHIGTDEFTKEGDIRNVDNVQAKRFREFTNRYLKFIADKGKTPRLWGGLRWLRDNPLTPVTPSGNAIMNAWSYDWVDPVQMLKDGFRIITTSDSWLYIVPAAGYYHDFLDTEWLYNNFRPEKVNSNQTLPDFQEGLLGSTFAVWNDICENGISQQDVHYRVYPALKVLATKNWKVTPSIPYATFSQLADSTSEGPGLNMIGKYSKDSLALIMSKIAASAVTFNGNTKIALGGTDFGYDYDISFDLNPAANNANAVLFQSLYSKITLNTSGTGKLGFSRDGYTYTFNYIPKSGWQNIRVVGDYRSVTLYVDGVRVEKLAPYSKNGFNFQQTLFFPLEFAGDALNGYKGEMKNLIIGKLDVEKLKAEFLATRTQITPGLYYIVFNNTYLTNNSINGSGGSPTFSAKNTNQTSKAQQWNITLDEVTGRYKITSAADNRYVNEVGVFGTNPYYSTWNSYNFYKKDSLYAIQNDGDAGKGFWYVANASFKKGDESYLPDNYIVKFVPVNSTAVNKIPENTIHLTLKDSNLIIEGVNVKNINLFSAAGKLVYSGKTKTIRLRPDWKGVFLVKVLTTENKSGEYKIIF